MINAACGLDWDVGEALRAGERGWNLKRIINIRLGLSAENDTIPKPLLRPYADAIPGETDFVPDFESMLSAYYQVRGWDPRTGYPNPAKLKALKLDWVVKDRSP